LGGQSSRTRLHGAERARPVHAGDNCHRPGLVLMRLGDQLASIRTNASSMFDCQAVLPSNSAPLVRQCIVWCELCGLLQTTSCRLQTVLFCFCSILGVHGCVSVLNPASRLLQFNKCYVMLCYNSGVGYMQGWKT